MNESFPADKPARDRLAVLLADMAHDIRTSLNAVIGFSEIMQQDRSLTVRQRERSDTISRSGKDLLGVMESLFDICRIHAGRASVDTSPFDLHLVIGDLEVQFARKNPVYRRLRTDLTDGTLQYVSADEARIQQVLLRMVECMARELQGRDVVLRVATEDRNKGKVLLCDITANGGIQEHAAGTGEPVSRDELRRMGIAPMIAGELVSLMGGTLTIGKDRTGSLFCHLEISIEEGSPLKEGDVGPGERQSAPGIPRRRENIRVLIVDDVEEDRMVTAELFSGTGFDIREAENGTEAVVQFEVFRPHIILMDLVMPVMNGLKAARTIREKADAQKTVIIAVTGDASSDDEKNIMEAGMNGYVVKPFDRESILAMIGQYMDMGPPGPNASGASDRPAAREVDRRGISEALLIDLQQAARSARTDILLELTATIEDRSVSERLREFIRRYDYKSIFELLGMDNGL